MSASELASPPPKRPVWLPDDEYPFPDRTIEIDGCRLHYLDEGAGPAILMLHGNPFWSFCYRKIVLRLRSRFRCIAPDYPGFGLSTAPPSYDFRPATHARIIQQLVERLELRNWTLMGNDWGGPIGLWVAGQRPKQVRALVIGNSWAWPLTGQDRRLRRYSELFRSPVGELLAKRLNVFIRVLVARGMGGPPPTQRALAAYAGPFPTPESRQPILTFAREVTLSGAWLAEVERGLAGLRETPTLITWGEKDPAFGPGERTRFAQLLPHHRDIGIPGAGHNLHEDAPTEVADAILAWWRDMVDERTGRPAR
jgi:haloalkane dehalogenase